MRSGFSTIKEAREAYAEIINNFGKKHILQIAQCCMKNFYTIFCHIIRDGLKKELIIIDLV